MAMRNCLERTHDKGFGVNLKKESVGWCKNCKIIWAAVFGEYSGGLTSKTSVNEAKKSHPCLRPKEGHPKSNGSFDPFSQEIDSKVFIKSGS